MRSVNYKLFNLAFICTVLMHIGSVTQSSAQVVLYLEMMGEEKPIKYYEGEMLSFRSAEYPDEWQEVKIDRIMDEEKMVLYDGGMLKMTDIIEVRRARGWANTIGYMLQTFGTAWLAFGGVAHFAYSTFTFGVDTLVIGGVSMASGWLIRKLLKYKKYKIGRRNRLKILDLSWPAPVGG